jgi:hypothetical protein
MFKPDCSGGLQRGTGMVETGGSQLAMPARLGAERAISLQATALPGGLHGDLCGGSALGGRRAAFNSI